MKTGGSISRILVIIASGLLLTACLLPGMIPLNPDATATAEPDASLEPGASAVPSEAMPTMEKDSNVVLESLQGAEGVYLAQLAKERYSDEEVNQPGTHTYTVEITDDTPTYFNYGWCTTTEEILQH